MDQQHTQRAPVRENPIRPLTIHVKIVISLTFFQKNCVYACCGFSISDVNQQKFNLLYTNIVLFFSYQYAYLILGIKQVDYFGCIYVSRSLMETPIFKTQ